MAVAVGKGDVGKWRLIEWRACACVWESGYDYLFSNFA